MIINDNNRIMLGGGALPPLHPPCWPAVGRRENIGSGGASAPSKMKFPIVFRMRAAGWLPEFKPLSGESAISSDYPLDANSR